MRTKAIIIKKTPTGEYNQLITCYTQELGKVAAVAKSSLKSHSAQAMHLDTLSLVEFELINGRATPIIAAAQEDETFGRLKGSLGALGVAYFFMEVLDKIVYDHQPDAKLWDFYLDLLHVLDSEPNRVDLVLFREKQAELLGVLGYPARPTDNPAVFSALDEAFEQTAARQLGSLKFLYSVI